MVENKVYIWSDWPLMHYNTQKGVKGSSDGAMPLNFKNLSLSEFHEKILHEPGFAEKWGELGPVYGKQWRRWEVAIKGSNEQRETIDQFQQIIDFIEKQHKTGIISRRMLITAWNPADLEEMAKSGLPPCHCLFQFHSRLLTLKERKDYFSKLSGIKRSVVEKMTDDDLDEKNAPIYELDLQLYQRSCDGFLGVAFNIASYALMGMMVVQVTNCKFGTFIHDYGDFHIYKNHLDQVVEQLSRNPHPYPTMKLNNRGQKIDEFRFDDFILENYNPHPAIKAEIAV